MQKMKMAVLAAGILILAGCGNKAVDNSAGEAKDAGAAKTESKKESGGIISSIKDAMNLGKTMECTYTIKDGMGPGKNLVSKSYVQGKKYMGENEKDGKTTIRLFDGEATYSWTKGEKTGTKMEQKCLDEISAAAPKVEADESLIPDDKISQEKTLEDATDVDCKDASGVDFSVPSDVIFTDQCEIMKNRMTKFSVPDGNIPANLLENLPGN
jgi:hypothetical protein